DRPLVAVDVPDAELASPPASRRGQDGGPGAVPRRLQDLLLIVDARREQPALVSIPDPERAVVAGGGEEGPVRTPGDRGDRDRARAQRGHALARRDVPHRDVAAATAHGQLPIIR